MWWMDVWHRFLRPVALLLGICLIGGVMAAGMLFPAAAALGLVSDEVGDSVNSVSTHLIDRPLPQTSTVTDNAATRSPGSSTRTRTGRCCGPSRSRRP